MRFLKDREHYYYDVKPGTKPKRPRRYLKEDKKPQVTSVPLVDFSWPMGKPTNLVHPFPIKGGWTYPKKGFIQWKNKPTI